MLIVNNGLEYPIMARYAGEDFLFPVGEDVACQEEVARHIFGFGEPDKTVALLRLGWITPGHDKSIAEERLNKIVFKRANVSITAAK
jgi:hypothetical protein